MRLNAGRVPGWRPIKRRVEGLPRMSRSAAPNRNRLRAARQKRDQKAQLSLGFLICWRMKKGYERL